MYYLIETSYTTSILKYVVLSYCWGMELADAQLKLLRMSAELLSKKHLISSLPKSFKETADVARRFEVNHLWIDRLCIYQDLARTGSAKLQQ